ncbi:hypothetical protein ACFLWX_04380, partial [Chloroflexota bacterium]
FIDISVPDRASYAYALFTSSAYTPSDSDSPIFIAPDYRSLVDEVQKTALSRLKSMNPDKQPPHNLNWAHLMP